MDAFVGLFREYINQPAALGLAIMVFMIMHGHNDKTRWESHDREALEFREEMRKKNCIIEKVDKYIMKFEDNQAVEKKKAIEQMLLAAKNNTTVIVQKIENYFNDVKNIEKQISDNHAELLDIMADQQNRTWTRLTSEGFIYEVSLMKEVSELLMPKYAEELKFMCEIYHETALNGHKKDTIHRLLQAFEQFMVNSWDKYFRKLAFV